MKLEYLIVRVLMTYTKEGDRHVYSVRGNEVKLGSLKFWQGSLEEFLDALGTQDWELTAGTTALSPTIVDAHLVFKRPK
ncbi:hypothetical protein IQ268_23020 [Oculatella sp. LEGE 06141]|uniref:hypothetical protein n=1 Tax=Oculatella sp. LEGE 06141 TaxID=1828648 RepID=UPI0018801CAF|nr:hypothetical protein [Oculatella sp. LEGE 06141]MBE9181439.1 hypothetical protein [Oculatella sp. LEGE 06141]